MISPPSNKEILELGLSTCVDGACLALKSYVGHARALVHQGIELLFVPQIISVARGEYTCPNFLGLPDLLRQYLPPSVTLLSPIFDARKGQRRLTRSYLRFGLQFAPLKTVLHAWQDALGVQHAVESSALKAGPFLGGKLRILVLGPRYLTDDTFLSGNLRGHLEGLGARVCTASQVPDERSLELSSGVKKPLFWSAARQSVGSLEHFIEEIDGVVNMVPFGCGAESLISVLIQRRARRQDLPTLDLVIDEHTSHVGLITRLEAFYELLERKKSG